MLQMRTFVLCVASLTFVVCNLDVACPDVATEILNIDNPCKPLIIPFCKDEAHTMEYSASYNMYLKQEKI